MPEPSQRLSTTAMAIEESVRAVIRSGTWRAYHGENLVQLREWFSKSVGSAHVRLCSSGTFAVELSIRSLKLSPSDEVILSSYDFPGNFRAIEDAGGQVVLCDPNASQGWVIDPERLEQVVAPKCRALVVSHLHGQLAPMQTIMEWANRHQIVVIEDACQAQGAIIDGKPAGSWGHIGVFSLGGSKLVSSGRGGVIVTNDSVFAQRMTIYCERGNDAYALSEIQAALALPQCVHLASDNQMRLRAASNLLNHCWYPWLTTFANVSRDLPAFYKIGFLLRSASGRMMSRDQVVAFLESHGVEVGAGFSGFANRSAKRYRSCHDLEQSRLLAETTFLIHHSMLLDPHTGEDSSLKVIRAFELLSEEMAD